MSERIRIWSNLDEFMTWEHNNCRRCVKREAGCDISDAISDASYEDGTLSPEMVARLAYAGDPRFWCAERQREGDPPRPAATEMRRAGAAELPLFGGG